MKKICAIFILLLICLTGCSNTEKVPKIDDYTWQMTSIQGGEDGSVIACSPEMASSYEGAKQITLICEAKNGKFTLTDSTNNKSYLGTYSITKTSAESIIYEILIDDKKGYATTGLTTYLNESQNPTFIIAIGDYALNFFSISAE